MTGIIALVTVVTALVLVVTWACSWPLLGLWRLATRRRQSWSRFNLAALAAPLFTGSVVAVGAVWPAGTLDLSWSRWLCHCDPLELFHLCVAHPQSAIPLFPAAVFMLVWLLWRPVRTTAMVCRRLRATRELLAAHEPDPADPAEVLLAELGSDNAATVGLFAPVVVADRRWWRSLAETDRAIVAAHEAAHRLCRDPLGHVLGQLLAGLGSERLGRRLVADWLQWAERRADAHAARVCGDPTRVAELLVRQKRAEQSLGLVPAFLHGSSLESRVLALLAPGGAPTIGSRLGLSIVATFAAWLVTVAVLGYPIHVAVEQILTVFS